MVRRRLWVALALVVVTAAFALAGCVDSSQSEAQTPAGASTVMNTAIQTDSQGKTITAPATAGSIGTGGSATTGGSSSSGGGGGGAAGDATAGKQVFAANCTACHMNDGTAAGGIGPKLQGMGLDENTIRNQVINGGGPMPAGLVSGTDLDNVVAYVLSIQK